MDLQLLVVTNMNDSGHGSLRQAIADAAAGDAISFAPVSPGQITLTTGELVISRSLTIAGPGADVLAVSGNQNGRVFSITTGSNVSISGLTIRDGTMDGTIGDFVDIGGGIKNSGALSLTNVTVSGNVAWGPNPPWGGGIYNEGRLSLVNTTISNNQAYTDCGGAICGNGAGIGNTSAGVVTIISSTVSGNLYGGGLYNEGTLGLSNSIVRGNNGIVGGIYNSGALNVLDSTVADNDGYGYHAGGIGGISNYGTLTMSGTTISGNTSTGDFGYIGGIANNGNLSMLNTTVSSNSSNGPYSGEIGGIYNTGVLSISFTTVSGNSTNGGSGGVVGGIYNGGVLTAANSIVANNTINGEASNCDGALSSTGHNLSSDSTCSFTAGGDISNTNALLGPLQNYGGPTRTQMPMFGSPAIDAGDNADCPAVDQRGVARPIDGNRDGSATCDIGAVEFNLTHSVSLPLVAR